MTYSDWQVRFRGVQCGAWWLYRRQYSQFGAPWKRGACYCPKQRHTCKLTFLRFCLSFSIFLLSCTLSGTKAIPQFEYFLSCCTCFRKLIIIILIMDSRLLHYLVREIRILIAPNPHRAYALTHSFRAHIFKKIKNMTAWLPVWHIFFKYPNKPPSYQTNHFFTAHLDVKYSTDIYRYIYTLLKMNSNKHWDIKSIETAPCHFIVMPLALLYTFLSLFQ